jgi:hypothetical protein
VEDFGKTLTLGPFLTTKDYITRAKCYFKVLFEYPRLIAVYRKHADAGWFDYGAPPTSFAELSKHPAVRKLMALRNASTSHSTCASSRI